MPPRPKHSNGSSQKPKSAPASSQNHHHHHHKPKHSHQQKQQKLQTNLEKALTLEQKLAALPPNNQSSEDETIASHLRIQLCEIFSDLLLTDPALAARKDVCGRLWRSCFYVRIGELRGRISKEKSRYRKLQKKLGVEEGGERGGSDLEKQGKVVKTYEDRLKIFIKEAVVLYEYLVEQYQDFLVPSPSPSQSSNNTSTQNQSQSQSQSQSESQQSTNSNSTIEDQTGVVPTLHRLYIYLGDLHRYTTSYTSADAAYLKAACLAPGKGNPYNQLAVVAQLKDPSGALPLPAVALYWYCRSLLAVHDAFETSRSNVERLFQANRKWLKQKIEEDQEEVMNVVVTPGTSREKGRAMRSAASRKFLSLFCDFHGSLFTDVVTSDGWQKEKYWEELKKDKDFLITQFDMLLKESAFGDALLLKMVSINAFSIWNGLSSETSSLSPTSNTRFLQTVMAVIFAFEYGAKLSCHTETFLERLDAKRNQQQSNGAKNTPSIRLIAPLLILCDFLSYMLKKNKEMNDLHFTLSNASHDDGARCTFFKSERDFWDAITKLNVCLKNSNYVSMLLAGEDVDDTTELPLPTDFKSMTRGYAPFAFLDRVTKEFEDASLVSLSSQKNKGKAQPAVDAYLSFKEAVDALELYPVQSSSQSSQRSKQSVDRCDSKVGSQSEVQTKLKLSRFMRFIFRHIESGEIVETDQEEDTPQNTINDQKASTDGILSPKVTLMDLDSESKDVEHAISNTRMDIDESEEDIVVYKETGNGPALLVPGAFLVNNNEKQKENQRKLPSPQSSNPSNAAVVNSTSGLLNLSVLLNQNVNDRHITRAQEDPSTIVGNHNTVSRTVHTTVAPPMPQSSSPTAASKATGNSVLRPPPGLGLPPGFDNVQKLPISNPQHVNHAPASSNLGNIGIQSTHLKNIETAGQSFLRDKNYGGTHIIDSNPPTLTPFHHSFNGRSDVYSLPGNATPIPSPTIPSTSNPFAYPMPSLGSSNNRFQGLNTPAPSHFPNHLGFTSTPPMGKTNEAPSYLGVNLNHNFARSGDTSTDLSTELGNDLFGLRSLGLFDDGVTKSGNGNSYLLDKDVPTTKNPFVYE